jgi:hypothetical protein
MIDYITVIAVTLAAMSVIALAWLGGYQLGQVAGINAERELSNRRINGLLAQENARKPRTRRARK